MDVFFRSPETVRYSQDLIAKNHVPVASFLIILDRLLDLLLMRSLMMEARTAFFLGVGYEFV